MREVQTIQHIVRPKRPLKAWFDVRRRKLGSFAFALNRLTGLGLALYLFLHLGILTILLQGEDAWNEFVAIAKSPFFLTLDIILLFGLLYHGFNGIRVAMVGTGIGVRSQRTMFWVFMALTLILLIVGGWLVFFV
ncbi:MAG: succinate dehydrogenase, cytochrome b556 subunit [Candidatus Promineifilaceae bacterium]